MKSRRFLITALILILGILFIINLRLEHQLAHYQGVFAPEMELVQKEERTNFNRVLRQIGAYSITKEETALLDSLRKQQNLDNFQSLLSQNIDQPFFSGFQSSLGYIYDSLALDYAKVELWSYLAKKTNIPNEFYRKKILLFEIPQTHNDSISFALLPIQSANTLQKEATIWSRTQRLQVKKFPIYFEKWMKKFSFTYINPLTKQEQTIHHEF